MALPDSTNKLGQIRAVKGCQLHLKQLESSNVVEAIAE